MELISRNTARDVGLKRFYTGQSCRRDHNSERWVHDGTCVECKYENWQKWANNNPKDYAQQRRQTYERCRERWNRRAAARHKANPEIRRERARKLAVKKAAKKALALLELNLKRASAGLHIIRTRKEAAALGEKYFYTGKTCRREHIEVPRATNTGRCVECNRENSREFYAKSPEKTRAWQQANKDKMAGYARKWQVKNPDKVAEYIRRWRVKNPEKAKIISTTYAKKNRVKIAAKARAKYVEKCRAEGREPRQCRKRRKEN